MFHAVDRKFDDNQTSFGTIQQGTQTRSTVLNGVQWEC